MSSCFSYPTGLITFTKQYTGQITQAMEDMTADLNRVASERSPWKGGTLQASGTTKVRTSVTNIIGKVSFKARNKGFNYAQYMDEKHYKPSEKSLSKGSARSKFAKGSLNVGSGYLSDTAKRSEDGYNKYLNKTLKKAIRGSGL